MVENKARPLDEITQMTIPKLERNLRIILERIDHSYSRFDWVYGVPLWIVRQLLLVEPTRRGVDLLEGDDEA